MRIKKRRQKCCLREADDGEVSTRREEIQELSERLVLLLHAAHSQDNPTSTLSPAFRANFSAKCRWRRRRERIGGGVSVAKE